MNIDPIISIIIPVYNTRPFLRQCLDSAVSQTYNMLDIIVIDDGSTDGSSEICGEYSSNPHVRVYHTPNHGLSAARNWGLDHLDEQCKFVAFLDSDDWMDTDCIQRLYDAAVGHGADLAECQFVNEYGNRSIEASQLKEKKIIENNHIFEEYLVSDSMHNVVWNKLYSVGLFNKIRFPVDRTFEDVATTYRLLEDVDHAVVIPDNLIHYRIRNGSLSHNNSLTKLKDSWLSYHERYCYLYEKLSNPVALDKLLLSCCNTIFNMWKYYVKLPKQDRTEARETIAQMKAFLKTHIKKIMQSDFFTRKQKIYSILLRFSRPVVVHPLSLAYTTLKKVIIRDRVY